MTGHGFGGLTQTFGFRAQTIFFLVTLAFRSLAGWLFGSESKRLLLGNTAGFCFSLPAQLFRCESLSCQLLGCTFQSVCLDAKASFLCGALPGFVFRLGSGRLLCFHTCLFFELAPRGFLFSSLARTFFGQEASLNIRSQPGFLFGLCAGCFLRCSACGFCFTPAMFEFFRGLE
jgi:hypothetical protein